MMEIDVFLVVETDVEQENVTGVEQETGIVGGLDRKAFWQEIGTDAE